MNICQKLQYRLEIQSSAGVKIIQILISFLQVIAIIISHIPNSQSAPAVSYETNEIESRAELQKGITHLENDPFEPVNLSAPVAQQASTMRTSRAISDGISVIIYLHIKLEFFRIAILNIT